MISTVGHRWATVGMNWRILTVTNLYSARTCVATVAYRWAFPHLDAPAGAHARGSANLKTMGTDMTVPNGSSRWFCRLASTASTGAFVAFALSDDHRPIRHVRADVGQTRPTGATSWISDSAAAGIAPSPENGLLCFVLQKDL